MNLHEEDRESAIGLIKQARGVPLFKWSEDQERDAAGRFGSGGGGGSGKSDADKPSRKSVHWKEAERLTASAYEMRQKGFTDIADNYQRMADQFRERAERLDQA